MYLEIEGTTFKTSFLLTVHINQLVNHKIVKKRHIKRIVKIKKPVLNYYFILGLLTFLEK